MVLCCRNSIDEGPGLQNGKNIHDRISAHEAYFKSHSPRTTTTVRDLYHNQRKQNLYNRMLTRRLPRIKYLVPYARLICQDVSAYLVYTVPNHFFGSRQ